MKSSARSADITTQTVSDADTITIMTITTITTIMRMRSAAIITITEKRNTVITTTRMMCSQAGDMRRSGPIRKTRLQIS